EKSLAHQPQAVRMQRDLLAVEVVSGLAAGCEREVTKLEGAFTKQVDQLLTVVHAGSRIPDERPNESGRAIPSALPVSIGRRRAHRWIRTVEPIVSRSYTSSTSEFNNRMQPRDSLLPIDSGSIVP